MEEGPLAGSHRRAARALGTVLLAATITACGANSDETAIRRAVTEWTDAVAAHDSTAACARLTPRLRASIERHLLGEGVQGTCRTWAARYVSPRHPATHKDPHIRHVAIARGERAVANLSAAGANDAKVDLVKTDGAWQIDDY